MEASNDANAVHSYIRQWALVLSGASLALTCTTHAQQ